MIGRPGTTVWLLSHEIRLAWRGLVGGKRGGRRMVAFAILGLVALAGGMGIAWALRDFEPPVNAVSILMADVIAVLIFTLMLSQTLASGIEALYTRGDLDLLFSSPLDPRKTLTVRFLALAGSAFAAFALIVSPFLAAAAVFGHWRWLAVFPVLGALALAASATGLALAVGLFALIGPRRTRTVAQVLAALIGAMFFMVSQARNLIGGRASTTLFTQVAGAANDPHLRLPAIAGWPLRAMLGEPGPLALVVAAGVAVFFLISTWLSRRFAADAAAAQGADLGGAKAKPGANAVFAGGPFAATFIKEVRLLRRDWALLSQVLLRVLYLIPAAFVLLRNAGSHASFLLPGGAAALAFLAGQVAGSLTWVTVSAEDAPELIASSPAPIRIVRRAKLAAGMTPLAVILVLPLVALIVIAPLTGVAATLGAAASAGAAGLINLWHQRPGKRSEFRTRRSGSILIGLAQLVVTLMIGGATALAAIASPFALIPAVLAGVALLLMRRSDAQIAEALAAES